MSVPIDLVALEKSIYAQGCEEAMLARIFELVPPESRYCVELGASDGLRNSNTALLLKGGWRGCLIEGSDYRFDKLQANWGAAPNVRVVKDRVLPDTFETILEAAGVPERFDLLSLDVDGNDYWLWKALERFRPRVVVVEYNPYYEPPIRWVMKYDPEHVWDGSTYYGASLESLVRLGRDKGYELICCDKNGNNAFFVERDLYARFELDDNAPQTLYRPAMYKVRYVGKNTFVTGHPYRYGPYEEL